MIANTTPRLLLHTTDDIYIHIYIYRITHITQAFGIYIYIPNYTGITELYMHLVYIYIYIYIFKYILASIHVVHKLKLRSASIPGPLDIYIYIYIHCLWLYSETVCISMLSAVFWTFAVLFQYSTTNWYNPSVPLCGKPYQWCYLAVELATLMVTWLKADATLVKVIKVSKAIKLNMKCVL